MTWVSATMAVLLATLALVTAWGSARIEQTHPPIGRFTEIDGLRLHYTDVGHGPPVVLLHGASTSLLDFHASLVEPLANDYRVIAIDRPGHGYSERPPEGNRGDWPDPAHQARLIRQLLASLDVDKPLLVGHSWASSVVLAYLLAYPHHASGGVLLAGGTHPWQGGTAWHNELAGLPAIGDLFAHTLVYPLGSLQLESAVATVFAPNPVPPAYIERTGVALTLRPQTFKANAEDLRRLSEFFATQSPNYPAIEHPMLLITGADDTLVPAWNHADRLIRQLPQARKVALEHTGHALHHNHPERVAELISAFHRRLGDTAEFAGNQR